MESIKFDTCYSLENCFACHMANPTFPQQRVKDHCLMIMMYSIEKSEVALRRGH